MAARGAQAEGLPARVWIVITAAHMGVRAKSFTRR